MLASVENYIDHYNESNYLMILNGFLKIFLDKQ